MRILVVGLRGIPGVQGGVETHAEELYQRLVELGCEISVVVRPAWYTGPVPQHWKGINIVPLWSPRITAIEPVVHTFLGILYGALRRPDVVHIHAVGPAVMTVLARAFGLKVVFTHHGADYDREKWGWFARFFLKLGERLGSRFSHQIIAVSPVIKNIIQKRYGRSVEFIPNGVNRAAAIMTRDALSRFGLTARKYVLQVSRIVPEKRQLDLLDAFLRLPFSGQKLVFVGGLDGSRYSRELQARAGEDSRVVLTDFQTGVALQELYSHAGVFVLPSSHEGLPIALLEAMSYSLPVLASDIPANKALKLDSDCYFELAVPTSLQVNLEEKIKHAADFPRCEYLELSKYDWQQISEQTYDVYSKAACRKLQDEPI